MRVSGSAMGADDVLPGRERPSAIRDDDASFPDSLLASLRLARTLDHAGIGIVETDAEGRFLRVNSGLCELTGKSEADMLGRSFFDETHAQDIDRDRVLYRQQVAGDLDRYTIEKRIARRDGSYFWAVITSSSVRNAEGRFLYAVRVQYDITDRKRAEEALALRGEEQSALYDLSKELQRTVSPGAIYEAALDAIIRALRCDRASILLFDAAGVMRFVAWRGLSDGYRKAVDGHSPWTIDAMYPEPFFHADLEKANLPADLKATIRGEGIGALAFIPLVQSGRLLGKFMVYFDEPHPFQPAELDVAMVIARQLAFAVERMHGEETRRRGLHAALQLASIVESSDDAIISKDLSGIVTSWNKGAERLFGYTATEMIGSPIAILIPKDRQDEEPQILRRIRSGERIEHYETVRQHKNGRRIDIWLTVSPMRDDSGRVIGASKIARDITERKQAESQQRILLNELNHRVKNNMQLLQSLLSSAARETASAEAKTALREAGDRLAAMAAAHRVLYSSADATRFQARAFLDAVCGAMRHSVPADVRIKSAGAPGELSNETAMPLALILNELLANAVKHSVNGSGGTIRASLTRDGDAFLLAVEDEGPGFDLDQVRPRASGLRLVEGLTRQLRGRFEVSRNPVSRCTVRFA